MIRQTIFSIADNDNNKLMTGELFEIEENQLKVVSLDGHRISIRNIELKNNYDHKKVVVPGKTLQEVSKILPGNAEEEVNIFLSDNHIVFEFDDTTVVSRLIEGEYFKIEQMLSSDYDTKVKINKRELLDCIDRATLLVKEGDKKPIIMNITDGNMELKINSFIGSMNEDIDITKEGKDILIGFNPKFFIDALRVIDEEEVSLYMVNPKAPCFIKDDEGKFIYLILPETFNAATNEERQKDDHSKYQRDGRIYQTGTGFEKSRSCRIRSRRKVFYSGWTGKIKRRDRASARKKIIQWRCCFL